MRQWPVTGQGSPKEVSGSLSHLLVLTLDGNNNSLLALTLNRTNVNSYAYGAFALSQALGHVQRLLLMTVG